MRLFIFSYLITIIIATASAVVVDDAAAAATNDVDAAKQARSLRGDIRTLANNATNTNDNNGNPNPGNGNGPPDKIIAIVTLKEESKTQGIANMCNQLSKANNGETKHTYDAVLGGCAIELPKPAMAGLKNNKHVEFIEEDQEAYTTATAHSWGQDRIDQAGKTLNGVINRLPATNVRIYILDTGIDQNHNDFNGMIDGGSSCHRDFAGDESPYAGPLKDGSGHGTHVASNTVGVKYGVATCNTNKNDCELCAVKVLKASGSGSFAGVIDGINHVVSNCPSDKKCVANLSLGGGKSTSVNTAVKQAVEAGIVMTVAAGNQGNKDDPDACNYSPASEPKAITVGSTDRYDKRSSFSSYGSCLDIYGPGSSIVAAKTGTTSSSSTKSGTSMASPHIAGLAAGILGCNPSLNPEQVRQKMLDDSVYLGIGDPYGYSVRLATTVSDACKEPIPSNALIVCGSTYGSCKGEMLPADKSELHEVRCCRDSQVTGWTKSSVGGDVCQNVWSESEVGSDKYCQPSSFRQALEMCTNMGGRLCTSEEILAGCTQGSGCGHDQDMIWSLTRPTGKYELVMGRSNANINQPRTKSADVAEQHEVRCCKDSETKPSGWANQNSQSAACQNVWSASNIPSCEHSANFGQALSLCANMGGRLCTAEEIAADCTAGSGCSHDSDHVWSSTVADVTTSSPTKSPSENPTSNPTQRPSTPPSKSPITPVPSKSPTDLPTNHPTLTPSKGPTLSPITPVPSKSPSDSPSKNPTLTPSNSPTEKPTSDPSKSPSSPPTLRPTNHPTLTPSKGPTLSPITPVPSNSPSDSPSKNPTLTPSDSPTEKPTSDPSKSPSSPPTIQPTLVPSATPSKRPTLSPITSEPSNSPSDSPSKNPTLKPSNSPSMSPVTPAPSKSPTDSPTKSPTQTPSDSPTKGPTSQPTDTPTDSPTKKPTNEPTAGITYYTVCGNSQAAADGRCSTGISATAAEETDVTALRSVRCCSDLRIDTGWKQHTNCANAYGVGTVWGESEIKANEAGPTENGVCHSDKTYAQAKQICANAGARLCTRYELENDCTRTTGCGFDFKLNWSSSSDMDLTAAYDDTYQAPRCNPVGLSCSSGGLLNGKASNVEPNPSNTIDGCADGTSGSYHGDESVDKITVSSVDGGKLTAGGLANIETKVWAWSDGSKDFADFYHAADASASSITWTYLGSVSAGGSDERNLSRKNFQLSDNPVQAVRVRFRYNGSPAPCNNGEYDDADDLVFAVEVNQNILSQHTLSFAEADTNPEPTAIIATDCSILIEDRCNASPDECYWKNNNKGCLPLRKDPV